MTVTVYRDLEQRSDEWYAARCGLVTASAVGALITNRAPDATAVHCPACDTTAGAPCRSVAKNGNGAALKNVHPARTEAASGQPPVLGVADTDTSRAVLTALAAERITGHVEPGPITAAMWRGIEEEPLARAKYAECYAPVEEVGFIVRDFGDYRIGYSPDGLVGADGLIEIKSRAQKAQVATVVTGEVPAGNMAQLQAGLLVTGRKWIDYISYSGGMAMWVKRVTPDPAWHDAIHAAAAHAEQRITDMVTRYREATAGLPMTDPTPDPYAEPVI